MNSCAVCWKRVEFGKGADQECGHVTHYKCLSDRDNVFEKCDQCEHGDAILPIKEIASFDGHDYVREPMEKTSCSREIERLFVKQVPIEGILIGKNLHLQELLHNGVTIDTFLKHGYDWQDLVKFQDMAEPGSRREMALYALHCNAEHFRKYADKLPLQELKIKPKSLVENFGLVFGEGYGPLGVINGQNDMPWTLEALLKLGIRKPELYAAGLYTFKQMKELASSEAELKLAGFTQKDMDSLYPPRKVKEYVEFSNVAMKKKRHGLKK